MGIGRCAGALSFSTFMNYWTNMRLSKVDVDSIFKAGRVVAVEYLEKDETARLISGAEGDPATHALCVCEGLDIVEACITGITESNLRGYLKGNCRLTVREAKPAPSEDQAQKAVAFWRDQVNKSYDIMMIVGMIPILFIHYILKHISQKAALWSLEKMPNLLAHSNLSTCAELAARGLHEFSLVSLCNYPPENVTPGILRTDDTLTTVVVLDSPLLIE